MRYCYYGKKPQNYIQNWIYDDVNPEIVFSFGGDGTMLGAIHQYEDKLDQVKFVGIKQGTLGFFCNFTLEELDNVVSLLDTNLYSEDNFQVIEYIVKASGKTHRGYAINEIAITNPINTQIIDVYINDKHFEKYRGTGFLVLPPAGSTAYNKSLGGSIVDPSVEAYQLTEIAPINNNAYKSLSSSLVLSKSQNLELKFEDSKNLYISVDGNHYDISDIESIKVELSNVTVTIVTDGETFFSRLKNAFL